MACSNVDRCFASLESAVQRHTDYVHDRLGRHEAVLLRLEAATEKVSEHQDDAHHGMALLLRQLLEANHLMSAGFEAVVQAVNALRVQMSESKP